jgi:hypothetical protein
MTSSNFRTVIEVADGSYNLSSTNYGADIIIGSISHNATSTNYKARLGFLNYVYAVLSDLTPPNVTLRLEDYDLNWLTFNWSIIESGGYTIEKLWLVHNTTNETVHVMNNLNDINASFFPVHSNDTYILYMNITDGSGNNATYSVTTRTTDYATDFFTVYPIVIAVVAGLFLYLAIKMDKSNHAALQIFFLMMGIYTIIVMFNLMSVIGVSEGIAGLEDLSNSMYWVSILVAVFIVLFLLLKVIVEVLNAFWTGR